jgi:hypothetical protein
MEEILNSFTSNHSLDEIVAGTAIDISKVPQQNKEDVIIILLHCCINGPVSPNKETTFPIIGSTCLNDIVGDQRITNNGLKRSCESLIEWLHECGYAEGFMMKDYGDFWPKNGFSASRDT